VTIRTRFDPATGALPEDVPQVLDMREDTPRYTRPDPGEAVAAWRRRAELAAAVAAFDPLWDHRARRPLARPGAPAPRPLAEATPAEVA
jgi:hypothetical protein